MSPRAASPPAVGAVEIDRDLFPQAFLRLLAAAPALVRRVRAGATAGAVAARAPGGPFLFRGHRAYRPGDDLRRLDWGVLARHDRLVVREFDAERDAQGQVWVDGSASLAAPALRACAARAAALACAVALSGGGRVRLGVLREGALEDCAVADGPRGMREVLAALSALRGEGAAGLEHALPRLAARVPSRGRWFLVSDLLTAADPSLLHGLAGRGATGALLHVRDPATWSPQPGGVCEARDAETGAVRTVRWTAALCTRVAARAQAHALRWSRHAREVGLAYLAFGPALEPEALLRRLALEVP